MQTKMDLISSIMIGVFIFMCLYLFWLWFCFGCCIKSRQKTRTSQQRRTYMGSRQRPSDSQSDPTVFVSPANLPPPPKYEAMAPPSYEEVVGVHYPNFQAPVQPINQPITQPITAALAQSSNTTNESDNSANSNANARSNGDVTTSTVVTVMNERTQVTVTAS
ncbi:uncharacterized protein LOC123664561 [Melitaea cinxia]|uniref:uncharacterized protein LOC123664561 n=1 Tax=Melitaea cinxia TaxID=113334 RepID=UPI001E272733|nr:uncharacterized protein LOC123664561 [Melitaea cinxia]